MVRNGHSQSWDSEIGCISKINDGMNCYFASWCRFKKAKNCFDDFWVGMVRYGCGHLVHETLKSAVSKE